KSSADDNCVSRAILSEQMNSMRSVSGRWVLTESFPILREENDVLHQIHPGANRITEPIPLPKRTREVLMKVSPIIRMMSPALRRRCKRALPPREFLEFPRRRTKPDGDEQLQRVLGLLLRYVHFEIVII